MESTYASFLNIWQIIMLVLTAASVIIGIVAYIGYRIKLASISDYKEKYDFIAKNDSKMLYYLFLGIAIGLILFLNSVYNDTVKSSVIWFFVRFFVGACIGTLVVYISYLMIKFAYPNTLEKKMKKWRYKPRINKKTGNTMKLLSEEEEDVHLDEGMQAEENLFSVDYDVWVDEESGDVQIEKYPGHLLALRCNSCGFKTMKLVKEEIIIAPEEEKDGEMIKNYRCSYCKTKRSKTVKVSRLSQTEGHYELPDHAHYKEEEKINMVTVDIQISNGKRKVYDFTSTDQAREFLKEFSLEDG